VEDGKRVGAKSEEQLGYGIGEFKRTVRRRQVTGQDYNGAWTEKRTKISMATTEERL
jgi:hypothetical protein